MSNESDQETQHKLDIYYDKIDRTILCRQAFDTGLFPASTDVNPHGDYTDAWVRDNVYSIQAIWGLYLAFQKTGHNRHRTEHLKNSVIKLMRGLLDSMMRQAPKVERFKYTQNPMDALHAKYATHSGETVVDDDKWGHLQLDATSIFLLMLAQMSKAGLQLIESVEEINFVQNLVWYIGRGYRTPDFGIWERGNKINDGRVEINASSVGMVKAALQAMDGINLLGNDSGQAGVIHIVADEVARCRTTLEYLLPRESLSKEVDAANLSVIGYPAFAIENQTVVDKTRDRIINKLEGRYGCKRFLLDGHQTMLEDHNRLHYESHELKNFEHIESEWPLFFAFLYLDALFRNDSEEAQKYRTKLDEVSVERQGEYLIPELYIVPEYAIEAEKNNPGSQERIPNNNVPLVWTQSLYYLGCLIDDGLISTEDLDPIQAHHRIGQKHAHAVQLVPVAQNDNVKQALANEGFSSVTPSDIEPVKILSAAEFPRLFQVVGQNTELGLTGRPPRRPRALATSQAYMLSGEVCLFLPQFQNQTSFYISADFRFLAEKLKSELSYVSSHWDKAGKPIMLFFITENMMGESQFSSVIELFKEIETGRLSSTEIITGDFFELLEQAGCERIDELQDYLTPELHITSRTVTKNWLQYESVDCVPVNHTVMSLLEPSFGSDQLLENLKTSKNIFEQEDILHRLIQTKALDFETGIAPRVTLRVLLEELYRKGIQYRQWSIVRRIAGVLGKYWGRLEDGVAEIVARQKTLVVGRAYSNNGMIYRPLPNKEILALIKNNCGADEREAVLNQEIIVILAMLIKESPDLFKGMMTVRPAQLSQLVMSQLSRERNLSPAEAFESLTMLSPWQLYSRIRNILESYESTKEDLAKQEFLSVCKIETLSHVTFDSSSDPEHKQGTDWLEWREKRGVIPRLNEEFYTDFWELLKHCKGIVLGDRFDLRSRIESDLVVNSMTPGEPQFLRLVEKMLNQIEVSSYRQMTIECLTTLLAFVKINPQIHFDEYLVLEVILGHAVRLNWLEEHPEHHNQYNQYRGQAWDSFYHLPPHQVSRSIILGLEFLLNSGNNSDVNDGHEVANLHGH